MSERITTTTELAALPAGCLLISIRPSYGPSVVMTYDAGDGVPMYHAAGGDDLGWLTAAEVIAELGPLDVVARPAPSRVARDVAAERARQDAKWGQQDHRDGTGPRFVWAYQGPAEFVRDTARSECQRLFREGHGTWLDILLEEVAEAFAEDDPARLQEELVQVAAVAEQWVEAIDRRVAASAEAGEVR